MRICLAFVLLGISCGPTRKPPNGKNVAGSSVQFQEKNVDLGPYLEGFPYSAVLPIWEKQVFLYDTAGKKTLLHQVPLNGALSSPAFERGKRVSSIDWSQRTRWDARYHPQSGLVYFIGDENNDEKLNLFRMDLENGTPQKLTDEAYIYGYSFNNSGDRVALLPRRGDGPYQTCLTSRPIDSSESITHLCDNPEVTFTWGDPIWAPDDQHIVTRVNIAGQRDRGNLMLIPLDGSTPTILTNPLKDRTTAYALSPWLTEQSVAYVSDEQGHDAVAIYDLKQHQSRWMYTAQGEISNAQVLDFDGVTRLLLTTHSPVQDALVLIDPDTAAIVKEMPIEGTVRHPRDVVAGNALVSINSTTTPFRLQHLQVNAEGFSLKPWAQMPAEIGDKIQQCDVKKVSFPTFDIDPLTKQPRQLHGYLYTPRGMTEPGNHLVRMLSFYGGENRFSVDNQIFCEAGIVTFSPAVRGSSGFGMDFYRLNDGDLGGDEFADLFKGAEWLISQGFSPNKIGVFGRSHGGYAAMRALTFPPGTNGHENVFPFAFGLADAGFSDIIEFHDTCNIPDWVLLEAGDPATEREKLLDRSPISHVEKLNAPLFLSHGENDSRVPVSGSRRMHEACQRLQKDCTFIEFPDQGHRVHGLANEQTLYQARFTFLERVVNTLTDSSETP